MKNELPWVEWPLMYKCVMPVFYQPTLRKMKQIQDVIGMTNDYGIPDQRGRIVFSSLRQVKSEQTTPILND